MHLPTNKAFFTKENLNAVVENHPGCDITMDPQVEDFLIDAANDFIKNVIIKTVELKKMEQYGNSRATEESLEDSEMMKFSMLSLYDVDVCLKKEAEIRKNKKIRRDNKKRISLKLAEISYGG